MFFDTEKFSFVVVVSLLFHCCLLSPFETSNEPHSVVHLTFRVTSAWQIEWQAHGK